MKLVIKKNNLERLKLNLNPIINNLRTAYNGSEIAEITKDGETITYTLILNKKERKSTEILESLLVKNKNGRKIPIVELFRL